MSIKNRIAFLILSSTLLLSSCLIDIPASKTNNPNVYIPPVINSALSDSVLQLFDTNRQLVSDSHKTNNISTYSIARASYFLGFTDLIKYNNKWYLSYRFSDGHVGYNFGDVIIMESDDFQTWKFSSIFTQKDYDLRDPKLFVADSTLFVHFHSASINPYYGETRNDYITSYNDSTNKWGESYKIIKNTNEKSWFWRIAHNKNVFYTISYINGISLFTSNNGVRYNNVHKFVNTPPGSSEAAIRFRNDSIYSVLRASSLSLISKSSVDSLSRWENIAEIPIELGGPNFLFYKNKLILTGRDHKKGTMALFTYNINTKKMSPIITLPSQLETGYSGMYIDKDTLYLSYYSGITTDRYSINVSTVNLSIF